MVIYCLLFCIGLGEVRLGWLFNVLDVVDMGWIMFGLNVLGFGLGWVIGCGDIIDRLGVLILFFVFFLDLKICFLFFL